MRSEPTPQRTYALIAALTLLVAAVMLCLDGVLNGDVYLQLASGRFIAGHGFVGTDPFPTVAHGQPWLNEQWLTELTFYGLSRIVGITGLTVLYALLLAASLALLLWMCRRKGTMMLIALAALFGPGAWMVLHPRAAGFTVLAFSTLVVLIVDAWLTPHARGRLRRRWAALAILLLFAVWANLHGGFVGGLLLLALVVVGLGLDHWRGHPAAGGKRPLVALALVGSLAVVTVTLTTPLGDEIWSYLLSFQNPAISRISSEWRTSLARPNAVAYLALAAMFVIWLWWRVPSPRALTPLLISSAFLIFALISVRNLIFVGPAIGLQIACMAPDFPRPRSRTPVALALAGAILAGLVWLGSIGPARNPFRSPLVRYALAHPPAHGRIASYTALGSYLLWRSPKTPVVLDGWLEDYSSSELWGTYSLLGGRSSHLMRKVRSLRVGAAIADRRSAARVLARHGFVTEFSTPRGDYLVRRSAAGGHPERRFGVLARRGQPDSLQADSSRSHSSGSPVMRIRPASASP
jgi:MFS family permease